MSHHHAYGGVVNRNTMDNKLIHVAIKSRRGDFVVTMQYNQMRVQETAGLHDALSGVQVGLCVRYSLNPVPSCRYGARCTYLHLDNAVETINRAAGRDLVFMSSSSSSHNENGTDNYQMQQQQQQPQYYQQQQLVPVVAPPAQYYHQQQNQQQQHHFAQVPQQQQPQPQQYYQQPPQRLAAAPPASSYLSAATLSAQRNSNVQSHEDTIIYVQVKTKIGVLRRRDFIYTSGLDTAAVSGLPVSICRPFVIGGSCDNGNNCRFLHAAREEDVIAAVDAGVAAPAALPPAPQQQQQQQPRPPQQQQHQQPPTHPQQQQPPPHPQQQQHQQQPQARFNNNNTCYICNDPNHFSRDCPQKQQVGGRYNNGNRDYQQGAPVVNWNARANSNNNNNNNNNQQQQQQRNTQGWQNQRNPHQQQQQQQQREERYQRQQRRSHYFQSRIANMPNRPAERSPITHGHRPAAQRLNYSRRLGFYDLPQDIVQCLPRSKTEAVQRDFYFASDVPCRRSIEATGHPLLDPRDEQHCVTDLHPSSMALNSADNVKERLHALLFAEEAKCIVDLLSFAKTAVEIRPATDQRQPHMYVVPAEGVSEKRPSVLRGDTIHCALSLPEGVPEHQQQQQQWHAGYVHFVQMDQLIVSFDPNSSISHYAMDPNARFDVVFVDQDRTQWRMLHRAVDDGLFLSPEVAAMLRAPPLLPNDGIENAEAQATKLRAFHPIPLNDNQMRFVETVCTAAARGSPGTGLHLCVGPPGTGKTSTIVSCIAGLCHLFKNVRILVTCPSNAASDLIVERLEKGYEMFRDGSKKMLRLHALSRSDRDVAPEVLRHSQPNGSGGFTFPTCSADLNGFAVVVSTLATTGKLYGIGVSPSYFSHVVVDEAGQATEHQLMLATTFLGRGTAGLLLAGDHKQLGPVIHSPQCKEGGMAVSGYERLCYTLPPEKVTLLTVNYRSHPSILRIVNVVYEDRLRAFRTEPPVLPRYMQPPAGGRPALLCAASGGASAVPLPRNWTHPVIFCHVEGREERTKESPSWRNMDEVGYCVGIVKQLINEHKESPEDIVILTPYLLQRETIEKALFGMIFNTREIQVSADVLRKFTTAPQQPGAPQRAVRRRCPVEVCTVEAFQGKEKKIVVVSCVRSRVEHVGADVRNHLGFMAQPQRSNVALSRAMDLLIIVANAALFLTDGMRDIESPEEAAAVGSGAAPLPIEMNLTHNAAGLWHTVITRIRDMGGIVNAKDPNAPVGDLYKQAWHLVHKDKKEQPVLPENKKNNNGDDDDDVEDDDEDGNVIYETDEDAVAIGGAAAAARVQQPVAWAPAPPNRGRGGGGRGVGIVWRESAPLLQME